MFLLLNAAIAKKRKNEVTGIPHGTVIKTPLTVKDVKDCFNRELSGKIPFAKFAVLPTVLLFLKNLFHNFCKLRRRAVKKNAYTVNFSRQNSDADNGAD